MSKIITCICLLYFTKSYRDEYVKQLYRYSPTTDLAEVTNPTNNNKPIYLNNQIVPGQNFMANEVFVNYDKDVILIRQFTKDDFYIYFINDLNNNKKTNFVYTTTLSHEYLTTPIAINSQLETFKTDIYFNGREKPTGVYQTIVPTTIIKKNDVIVKQPETTINDIKKYNKKLFREQLNKIVSNQSNKFENIKAEFVSNELGIRHKSTIRLEGFNEAQIINFSSTSYLHRYEATSISIKGKATATIVLDMLDKEEQTLTKEDNLERGVELDMKARKQINYLFKGVVNYNPSAIKCLQLDAYCNAVYENADYAIFTITIPADKPAK